MRGTLIFVGTIVVLIALVFLFLFLNQKTSNDVSNTFTFEDCVANYGLDKSKPLACNTPSGSTYFKFKTKSKTYEECVQEGGETHENACSDRQKRYIPKFPNHVNTYNKCKEGYPRHIVDSVPEPYICVDRNGLAFYAGGKDRKVNSYEECASKGGPIGKNGTPHKCYFDTVVYYQTLKPSHKYLNLPYELKTFEDCVLPGIADKVGMESDKPRCIAFNNKKYFYDGPKIDSYEDCARVMKFILTSNPPQCYGPDGTHYVGTRD